MFGGSFYTAPGTGGAGLTVNSPPIVDALNWQMQFYDIYAPEDLETFISSFTPYMTSRHAIYAGRRLDCQQCHRASPLQNTRIPSIGFREGRVAMMIDGQWQTSLNAFSHEESQVNYGLAPFPPPAAHPERAGTNVVQGPVVFMPAAALDKAAAADLLAWMMSPEIAADAAYAASNLPTSRAAAQDPRFHQIASFELFLDLIAHPNARPTVPVPITPVLNEALGRVEDELRRTGGDPEPLLNELQIHFAPRLEEALSYDRRP
jgi:hypothetical protein